MMEVRHLGEKRSWHCPKLAAVQCTFQTVTVHAEGRTAANAEVLWQGASVSAPSSTGHSGAMFRVDAFQSTWFDSSQEAT